MDNDNQLQKIPEYSVSKIIRKSDLATRGLRELGLLKNKKHFTIIYGCQFCGRLINSTSTPCIYCGKLPKTKKEIVIAQALSSESMSIGDQLRASCWIKEGRDLEIEIHDLREVIDRVTSDWKSYPVYDAQFKIAKDSASSCTNVSEKIQQIFTLTKNQCSHCSKNVRPYIHDKCENCHKDFPEIQKLALVIKQILDFIEIFLDGGGDDESIEELIFILVHTINRAVEKEEYPNQELLKRIYELFHKSHYLISYRRGVGIEIKNGEVCRLGGSDGVASTKEDWLSVLLAVNVDYLLQQCKQQNAEEKALGPSSG